MFFETQCSTDSVQCGDGETESSYHAVTVIAAVCSLVSMVIRYQPAVQHLVISIAPPSR